MPVAGAAARSAGVDAQAVIRAYELHGDRIFRLCLARLGNVRDAEDAVQETFAGAAHRLDRLTGDTGAYLCAVARRVCYDIRHSRWCDDGPLTSDRADPHGSPEDATLTRVQLDQLWKVLTPAERRMFSYVAAGFRYQDIARLTGLSAKCVSVRLVRARQRVRAMGASALAALLAPWRRLARWRPLAGDPRLADPGLSVAAQLLAAAVAAVALTRTPAAPAASAPATASVAVAHAGGAGMAPASSRSLGASWSAPPARPESRPAPSPTTPGPAPPQTLRLVGPPDPDHAVITSFTASPGYAQDHTVFAAGYASAGCLLPACAALFRSTDGGGTWIPRTAAGYTGGRILLLPSFRRDGVIFTMSPGGGGLLRSDDGGASFQPTHVPFGPAAVSPHAGDILVAPQDAPGTTLSYDASTGIATPGPALPPDFYPEDAAYTTAGSLLLVGQPLTAFAGPAPTDVVRCVAAGCASVTEEAPDGSAFHLAVSSGGLIALFSQTHTLLSYDDGATWATAPASTGTITAETFVDTGGGSAPELLAAVTAGTDPRSAAGIAVLTSPRAGWRTLSTFAGGAMVSAVATPQTDIVLAALFPTEPDGPRSTRCSTNSGTTWARSC